jgi:hypothetical protein
MSASDRLSCQAEPSSFFLTAVQREVACLADHVMIIRLAAVLAHDLPT